MQLGVTGDALRKALSAPSPDFDAAAAQLGVTVDELIAAVSILAGAPHGGQPPTGVP